MTQRNTVKLEDDFFTTQKGYYTIAAAVVLSIGSGFLYATKGGQSNSVESAPTTEVTCTAPANDCKL